MPTRPLRSLLRAGVCPLALVAVATAWWACERRSGTLVGPDPTATPRSVGPHELAVLGFYNVENLFDPADDPDNPGDDEFLPAAAKRWDSLRYAGKLELLARVIAGLGGEGEGPALLGLAEVENARVLRDLAAEPALADGDYGLVHYDSPDYRGIDVALLYRRGDFRVLTSRPIAVTLPPREGSTRVRTTRDVLYVAGLLRGDTLHLLVNHWPSRGGGEERSRPDRARVARVVRGVVDSLRAADPAADVAVLGDLNDDPTDASVAEVLGASGERALASDVLLYNPFVEPFRRGEGSLGYRRQWNLFDQIVVSAGLTAPGGDWSVREAAVFAPAYLLQDTGRYRGFPERTYIGDAYRGGASDHLPVYVVLERPR